MVLGFKLRCHHAPSCVVTVWKGTCDNCRAGVLHEQQDFTAFALALLELMEGVSRFTLRARHSHACNCYQYDIVFCCIDACFRDGSGRKSFSYFISLLKGSKLKDITSCRHDHLPGARVQQRCVGGCGV